MFTAALAAVVNCRDTLAFAPAVDTDLSDSDIPCGNIHYA
jgi:hypothetical protein